VRTGTVTASVFFFDAVLGEMVPTLAFHAPYGLALGSLDLASSVADYKSVGDRPVSCVGAVEGDEKVCCPLAGGSLLYGLDPLDRGDVGWF
jgi:hypothetical protein